MSDQLYNISQVSKRLAINAGDVGRLIAGGQLRAITQVIRGTGKHPRRFVRESELTRYIRDREAAADEAAAAKLPRKRAPRAARVEPLPAGFVEYV